MPSVTIQSSAQILNRVDFSAILDELLHFFRIKIPDRQSRSLTGSETFTGDGTTTIFEFTNDLDSNARHKVMAVYDVYVDGVQQVLYRDFIVGFRKSSPILGKIMFWNPPANGAAITLSHNHTYHFIYAENPRVDLTSKKYPRISLNLFNAIPTDVAIGGKCNKYDIIMTITVVDIKRDYVESTVQKIKDALIPEYVRHGFTHFNYIHNVKLTPLIPNGEDPNDIVYVQQLEFTIPLQYEFSR